MKKKVDALPSFKQPETISSSLVHYLEDAILKGRIRKGTRLIERELAERFKVSKHPVREALRELQAAGLVKITPRKGAVVRQISLEQIKDIYAVKCLIESFAAGKAAKWITQEEIKELRLLIDRMSFYIKENNAYKYVEIAENFHHMINRACRNRELYEIYKKLTNQILWHEINYLSSPGRVKHSFEEHKKILEALIGKDAKQAESLMKEHIEFSEKVLLNRWRRSKNLVSGAELKRHQPGVDAVVDK